MLKKNAPLPKHATVREALREEILRGEFVNGDKLPTEKELTQRFAVSRPTIARALLDLQHDGLVERKMGSGSYVRLGETAASVGLLGLLIPGLGETEIFEPICGQMAEAAEKKYFTLLWSGAVRGGRSGEAARRAEELSQRYIEQQVDGVFFAPLELESGQDAVNQRIVAALQAAAIPIVLLDRDLRPFPARSGFDLVGVDNYQAGYLATRHLLQGKAQRVDFLYRPYSAPTVDRRIAGYQAALIEMGVTPDPAWVHCIAPEEKAAMGAMHRQGARAVVCANDATAAVLLEGLSTLGLSVPQDMRLIGFDDVRYARHLRTPLSTMRQPCQAMGRVAMDTMMSRIAQVDLPPRSVQLACELVVRESCGVAS